MFMFILVIAVAVVLTSTDVFSLMDVALISAAFLPMMMYYRRRALRNVMMGWLLVIFTVIPVIVLGLQAKVENFNTSAVVSIIMLTMTLCLGYVSLVFFAVASDKYIKLFSDSDTFAKCLSVIRNKLYSLRNLFCLYVIIVGSIYSIRVYKDLQVSRWQLVFNIIIYTAANLFIAHVVDKSWASKAKEVLAKEEEAREARELEEEQDALVGELD